MLRRQTASGMCLVVVLVLVLSGCNLPRPVAMTPTLPPTQTVGQGEVSEEGAEVWMTPNLPATQPVALFGDGGMQVRFVNLTDGGTVAGTLDEHGKPLVVVQVEVTGNAPLVVNLTANGLYVLDVTDRFSELTNPSGLTPFRGDIQWSPLNGGGEYTLVASAMDNNKQIVEATVHVTVTSVPVFTPTPPPLSQADAVHRISDLIQQQYGVNIPAPSMQRFDFPKMPNRSRWISSAFYKGKFYYIQLFDDTHYELSPGEYADPANRSAQVYIVLCKPAGLYKVLVLFVDYGNVPGINRDDALAQVPVMINWVNELYIKYAASQGMSSPPMRIEGDAAYVSIPPSPGNLLSVDEVRSLTGFDPTAYDFVIEIDIDVNISAAKAHWPGIFSEPGGGLALQGCGSYEDAQTRVNIWSSLADPTAIQGALSMDLTHEMSHLFGLSDNWPFKPQGLVLPDGSPGDDWIPYVMFGWTDTDSDGIPEIIDPTPYGTTGPQP